MLSLNDLLSSQAMQGLNAAKDGVYENGPITTEFHSSANGFSFEMRMTTGRVGPEAAEKEKEELPKCPTPGCYDAYGGLHPCGSPECAEYASTCTCWNGEASRTEAVEPAGADEEVDEIGRPLRPSRRQPNLRVELPVVVVQTQSDVTLYKVAGDECGQVTFEKTKQL